MQTDLLTDDRFRGSTRKDLALMSMAARRFGSRLREAAPELVDRMLDIAKKTAVEVVTKTGEVVESEALADENSMRATEILTKMITIEQKDEHHADRIAATQARPQQSPSVNVQINNGAAIASSPDTGGGRASAILERLRVARLSDESSGG